MPTSQTSFPPNPQRIAQEISPALLKWLIQLANQLPLREVDTTAGAYAEDAPPAGLNSTTGQNNQNQEIIYKKLSADGNTFTLNGTLAGPLPEGPRTLTAQYDYFRIKSNGTSWYRVG